MHNRALHEVLEAFVHEAAHHLTEDVSAGAEIPFELADQGRGHPPLYCYRPMSDSFIRERVGKLSRLPSFPAAARGVAELPGLEGYLHARGLPWDRRDPAAGALTALLCAMWGEETDFAFEDKRFEAVFGELERLGYAGSSLSMVVAAVEGLVLGSEQVPLGGGLSLVRAGRLADLPADLRGDLHATLVVLELHAGAGEPLSLEAAGRRLRRLQTALRLWHAAEPAIGPVAWARTDGGPWLLVALSGGMRRTAEDCLLTADDEDPLRAFCGLVARRSPRSGELAWALRRFELGVERGSGLDALTDWLLAARALLADTDGTDADVCERLAAICAPPEESPDLAARLLETAGLERRLVAGMIRPDARLDALVAELGDHLRAVLRDVLCGHLDPELRRIADEAIRDREEAASPV
jgi:hypothetical protein